MTLPLFGKEPQKADPRKAEELAPSAWLFPGLALSQIDAVWDSMMDVIRAAPLRQMVTPSGLPMSVAMTSCGAVGWVSSRGGYRYSETDPQTGLRWPVLSQVLFDLAQTAASRAGFDGFLPDSCLVNHYTEGTKLSLHQDKDERDFTAPIVSVSIGVDAVFLLGGLRRSDSTRKVRLSHGDVVVFGGPSRLRFHGVLPIEHSEHLLTGSSRYNLTLRKAH